MVLTRENISIISNASDNSQVSFFTTISKRERASRLTHSLSRKVKDQNVATEYDDDDDVLSCVRVWAQVVSDL